MPLWSARFQVDHCELSKKRKHLPNLFRRFSIPFSKTKHGPSCNDGARGVSYGTPQQTFMCANIIGGVFAYPRRTV